MVYTGPERRQHPRAKYRFVVSYRVLEEEDNTDITQTKNLGLGGMWLTTNRKFKVGEKLALDIRLPLAPDPIKLIGVVVDSKEVVSNLIYDTHLEFLSVDENYKKTIGKTVERYSDKKEE
jgi:hypothetical protein